MDVDPPNKKHVLSKVVDAASKKARAPVRFIEGYPEMLAAALSTGRRLNQRELDSRRELGKEAAGHGISLRALIDLYLGATRLLWRELGEPDLSGGRSMAEMAFQAAEHAVGALAEGYDAAHHLALRQEESARREFIDDLFSGRSDLGRLAERAQVFGMRLAEAHIVTVARADEPFAEATTAARTVESALATRFGTRDVLTITKDDLLVCIAPSNLPQASTEFARHVEIATGPRSRSRVGVGRPHRGPGGVLRSYEEARRSIDLATRLGHTDSVVRATDFLVFEVLLRDRAAISDLIVTVLGPLQDSRGGAVPLLDTLGAYFSRGTVPGAARELNLSTRAVAYRLQRVSNLTGYSPTEPGQRFTLEAAVRGARLLDWPLQPLESQV